MKFESLRITPREHKFDVEHNQNPVSQFDL